MRKCIVLFFIIVFLLSINALNAEELENGNNVTNLIDANLDVSLDKNPQLGDDINHDLKTSNDEVIVDDWDDLQYYASRTDKNYVVKLKENTGYYPKSTSNINSQMTIRNNLTIIGNSGAYIGDSSSNSNSLKFNLINVPIDSGMGIVLDGITFKNIFAKDNSCTIIQMSGNANNAIKNCNFENINISSGKSTVVHIVKGDCLVDNCSFVNITQGYGTVSAYCPSDDPQKLCTSARLKVYNSYFENNFATSEPGCINNCGVLIASNTTFYNNRASVWAGAIHTHSGANSTIIGCDFIDNLAGWNGGAIYTYSYLQIYNSTFRGNNCTTNNGGGAIGACTYKTSPYIYIENSLFENNENLCWGLDELSTSGTGRGGAISIMDAGSLKVFNTTFIKNSASIGPAICAIVDPAYGSPDVELYGNKFINHTRVDDVVVINLDGSSSALHDNYYFNNSIKYSKFQLIPLQYNDEEVTFEIQSKLTNSNYYDSDILDKCEYDVYVDGSFVKKIKGNRFSLNFEDVKTYNVHVLASISNKKSNVVPITITKKYIYVSKDKGNDDNDGLTRTSPVYSLSKAISLAKSTQNIILMDGQFNESNFAIDFDLNIRGENDAGIGGFSILNDVFDVNDARLSLKNIKFRDLKSSNADLYLFKSHSSVIIIDRCVFENNNFNNLLKSENTNIKNTIFKNNMFSIEFENLTLDNVSFINNTAFSSSLIKSTNQNADLKITDSLFYNNFNLSDGIIQYSSNNHLDIINSIFDKNQALCISIGGSSILNISSSIFQNNDNALMHKGSQESSIIIKNSVILNNSINSDDGLITGEINNIDCDYNWWGNTFEDVYALPNLNNNIQLGNWFVLNLSFDSKEIELKRSIGINVTLNNLATCDGVISYAEYNLPKLKFILTVNNATLNKYEVILENGKSNVILTLNSTNDAWFNVNYNDVNIKTDLEFIKSNSNANIKVNDILVGQDVRVEVSFPKDATGNVTLTIDNRTETKTIDKSKVIFLVSNLYAGVYELEIDYSGDIQYESFVNQTHVVVKKYDALIQVNVPNFELNDDVDLTFTLPEDATGNLTVDINGIQSTLYLENAKATYTIKNITRGDWKVNVTYNGDSKYGVAHKYFKFGAYKPNSTIIVNVLDTKYGEDAIVEISLADDATGYLTVKIDDHIQSKALENAYAKFNFTNLDAGTKNVLINYTGDENYNEVSYLAHFNIEKTTIDFNISVDDINEGQDAIVRLSILSGASGTFTLKCGDIKETISIPKAGSLTWIIPDLKIGEYNVSATYNGNQNYYIARNNATFNAYPWNQSQWPNDGFDTHNTGKSTYQTNSNGEVLWVIENDCEVIGNMVIDDVGNLIFITTSGIYSYDDAGKLVWKFNSSKLNNFTALAIGRDVVISPVSGDTLYLINKTSGKQYGYSNIYQGSSIFSPIVDDDGNIYITSEYQHIQNSYNLVVIPYKQWYDGVMPIEISLGRSVPTTAPVIVNENIVCICCEDGLKLIDVSQNKVISVNPNIITKIRPVVSNGIIYSLTNNSIIAITADNLEIFNHKINSSNPKHFVLDENNGFAYSVDSDGKLYKYDIYDGVESLVADLNTSSGLLIGNDGTLYFGSGNNFYALNSNGEMLWKSILKDNLYGTPIMGNNGVIYMSGNNFIYAITNGAIKDPMLNVLTYNVTAKSDVEINISLNSEATGKINILFNNQNHVLDVIDGKAVFIIDSINSGQHILNVSYSGDLRFDSSWQTILLNINKAKILGPGCDIVIPSNGVNGKILVDLPNDAKGILTVFIDGKKYYEYLNLDSNISLPNLNSGQHMIMISYDGDLKYDSFTVNKSVSIDFVPKITGNKNLVMDYNSGLSYTVRVYGTDGKVAANDYVIFKINNKIHKVKTNQGGYALLKINEVPKVYTITAEYKGIKVTNKVTVKQILKSKNYKVKKSAKKLILTATLKSSKGKAIKNKNIVFKLNGKSYKAKTNKKGIAKVTIKKKDIKKLKINKKYQLKISYNKDIIKKKVLVKK